MQSIEVENENINFEEKLYDRYEGKFDLLDRNSLKITVHDNVGNYRSSTILTHHFGNLDIEDMAIEYNDKYLLLNSDEYNQDSWDEIENLYTDLNILLMTEDSTLQDFENVTAKIDTAIEGQPDYKYRISSVPQGISTTISYTINESDINDIKKGDSISLVLDKLDCEESEFNEYCFTATNLADFDESMAKPFSITFLHNGTEIDYDFEEGTEINMSVPFGYEARYFKVVNLETEELIDSETINNTITFNVKGGGKYALVIEGQELRDINNQDISGIKVFGKTISWLSFGLSLGGVILITAVLIFLVTYKYKKIKINKNKK